MKFRKLTSLLMMIGLVTSLFHPLAHAGSPENHGDFRMHSPSGTEFVAVSMVQVLDQIGNGQESTFGHDEDGFATNHCETCHVFAHIFTIFGTQSGQPISKMPVHAGLVASPVTADVLRFERPPRPIA